VGGQTWAAAGGLRETIRKSAEPKGRHLKQSGGTAIRRGQDSRRTISGRRVRNSSTTYRRTHPEGYITHRSRLRERSKAVSAGSPCRTSRLRSTTAAFHDVDSSENGVRSLARGLKEAARKGQAVLLEPIMAVEVVGARKSTWGADGDLNSAAGALRNGTAEPPRRSSSHRCAFGDVSAMPRSFGPGAGPRQFYLAFRQVRGSPRLAREEIVSRFKQDFDRRLFLCKRKIRPAANLT